MIGCFMRFFFSSLIVRWTALVGPKLTKPTIKVVQLRLSSRTTTADFL